MNIGIIVYSQTGNTLSTAKKLKEALLAGGHSVKVDQITVVGEPKPGAKNVHLGKAPTTKPYDALVFCAPVHAFSLATPMQSYLNQVASLQNKKVACLVTQAFPYPWMGGNRAIRQMKNLCKTKGATMCGSAVVNWANARRAKTLTNAVDCLSKAI